MKQTMESKLAKALLGLCIMLFCHSAWADTAVIVHPSNSSELSTDDIAKIYLGKTKKFPNGSTAVPLDQKEGTGIRDQFLDSIVGKSPAQMKSYWSRLIFTGKGVPPKVVESSDEIKSLVSRNPDTIGYIDASEADDTVKVVATF